MGFERMWEKLTLDDPRVMTLTRVKVAQKSSKVDPP
jgi:hypothetical protein